MLRLGEICALGWTLSFFFWGGIGAIDAIDAIGFIDFILLWCGIETAPPLFPAPLPPPRKRGGGVHVETAPPF